VYYAVLAYPNTIELARRRNFAFAMAALRIKTFSAEIGSRKDIPPRYTGFKNEKIRSAKNLAWKPQGSPKSGQAWSPQNRP